MSCPPPTRSVPSRSTVKRVAAVRQERVDRHPVARRGRDRDAVERQRRRIDPLTRRPARVPAIGEARRHLQDAVLPRGRVVELLLEHPAQLLAGERERGERVAERLDGERLAEGDRARRLAARGHRRGEEVGPDPAGVHQRELGAVDLRRRELGVGDQVTQRRLARRRGLPGEIARRPAEDAVGQRGGLRLVALHERLQLGVGRDVLGDRDVASLRGDQVAGATVEHHVDVGDEPPEGQAGDDRAPAEPAVVALVGMAGEHDVDRAAHVLDDRHDRAGEAAGPGASCACAWPARPPGCSPTGRSPPSRPAT